MANPMPREKRAMQAEIRFMDATVTSAPTKSTDSDDRFEGRPWRDRDEGDPSPENFRRS
jgi:hypothetical protein